MNLIVISTGSRPALLRQTLTSLRLNAADWSHHHLTVVLDGRVSVEVRNLVEDSAADTIIINQKRVGASRSRNIGASSIPVYLRQRDVMFCDDDVAFAYHWDAAIDRVATEFRENQFADFLISPYGHPYNLERDCLSPNMRLPTVLSSVAMMMPWRVWDRIGPWDEPGGSGCSEDVAICARANVLDMAMAVTSPHAAIHCGLTSSNGKPIVGSRELASMNDALIQKLNLQGKVLQC